MLESGEAQDFKKVLDKDTDGGGGGRDSFRGV